MEVRHQLYTSVFTFTDILILSWNIFINMILVDKHLRKHTEDIIYDPYHYSA